MTPSALMMDALENEDIDSIEECMVIFKRTDGTIGYRTAKLEGEQTFYDSLALLNFSRLSIEHDLREYWSK